MNFDDLKYNPSLDDSWERLPELPAEEEWVKDDDPVTEGQLGYLRTLFDSTAMNALTEEELRDVGTIHLPSLTVKEAAELIDRIIAAQPNEPNLRKMTDINRYLLRFT